MDVLLLAAGAVVLIGITLWIVWPARSAESVGKSVQGEEVSDRPMAETVTPGLPPQGDRFEDQYTSATADLSAGGVAAAVEAMQAEPEAPPPPPREAYATPIRPTVTTTTLPGPETTTRSLAPKRTIGLGAGAGLAVAGGVGGAWLYARWQRERNKPINRLRRSAREIAGRLTERMPDVDELPSAAAPMSGAATALLLTAMVASRALRRGTDDTTQEVRDRADDVVQDALERGRDAVKRGRQESAQLRSRGRDAAKRAREEARELRSRVPDDAMDQARKPLILRIGIGGVALIAGGAFVIWRLMHRGQPDRSTWYAGE